MKKHFLKALSLIMAVSLLCSCTSQENTPSSSPAPETSSTQQENSTDETTADSQGTSKPETEETTATTTPEPETTTTTTTTPKPETTTTTTTTKPELVQDVSLDIEGVDGYITYPSGSGITAVATVLKYYGIDASVIDLCNCADVYGDIIIRDGYTPSPWEKIVVSPGTYDSVYYAPPIVNMANKYLTNIGSDKRANDVSGTSLEELLEYIENGIPVIIWATETEKPAEDGASWIADNGEEIVCKKGMTVFVMKGYTNENIQLIYHSSGLVIEYSHDLVNDMYQSVYSQAIIIE